MSKSETSSLLFEGGEWNFEKLKRTFDAIQEIAIGELGLDPYPADVEVISSEQMLEAYSSIGMPVFYRHWSFGKRYVRDKHLYRTGRTGLAYEIVINSNPSKAYLMEENTMTMQALVMAHACFGHSHFFKNNQLFREWTDADGIIDYLAYAQKYIARCEEKYSIAAVERILDAAHALQSHGVDHYSRRGKINPKAELERQEKRRAHKVATFNDLWRTLPKGSQPQPESEQEEEIAKIRERLKLPEENLLYFVEKFSPVLKPWEKEVVRIVRKVAQYFYPQRLTKVMNEGCATYVHYRIMNRLYDLGKISEGSMLEFLQSHSNVVFQPDFDDPRFSGINPYALGFEMMRDIERVVTNPTAEDYEYLPQIAGKGDVMGVLKEAWADHRDESFVRQYLSPHLMRQMRLFKLRNDSKEPHYLVEAIHEPDAGSYDIVRRALADQYDASTREPNLQVVDVDLLGNRKLCVEHFMHNGIDLEAASAQKCTQELANLWGYEVSLRSVVKHSDNDSSVLAGGSYAAMPEE